MLFRLPFFILFAMDGKIEQCACNKFRVKLSKFAVEVLETLHEASGEHSLSRAAGFELHSRYRARRVSVEDDESSGRPSTQETHRKC
jgi:hypothetical protein